MNPNDKIFYASAPFSGRGLPPFEKGGQGGFAVGLNMKIPLGPHFSKGEVMQCNAHLKMVQRHKILLLATAPAHMPARPASGDKT